MYASYSNDNKKFMDYFSKIWIISSRITMLIPIMSGVYLFTALYFIRRSLRNEVNIKAMILHATSFGFYMASVLLYVCVCRFAMKISKPTYLICYVSKNIF